MQIRIIFALPSLVPPLPWCPGQLPQSPTPRSTTFGVALQEAVCYNFRNIRNSLLFSLTNLSKYE